MLGSPACRHGSWSGGRDRSGGHPEQPDQGAHAPGRLLADREGLHRAPGSGQGAGSQVPERQADLSVQHAFKVGTLELAEQAAALQACVCAATLAAPVRPAGAVPALGASTHCHDTHCVIFFFGNVAAAAVL